MADSDRLTARQRAAVQALATSRTIGEACEACGVPERTIQRWRKQPAFMAALREAEGELWRAGLRYLLTDQRENLESLVHIRQGGTSPAVRLRAAVALEAALQKRWSGLTLEDLEQRIAALEAGP